MQKCPRTDHTRSKRTLARTAKLVAPALLLCGCLIAPATAFGALANEARTGVRYAYIDPGAGSFVVQALVAAAAGVAVAVKVYWRRIKGLLGLSRASEEDEDGG
jgi:hypothetical protein